MFPHASGDERAVYSKVITWTAVFPFPRTWRRESTVREKGETKLERLRPLLHHPNFIRPKLFGLNCLGLIVWIKFIRIENSLEPGLDRKVCACFFIIRSHRKRTLFQHIEAQE